MTSTRRRIGSPDDRKRAGARGQRTRDGCPRRWFGATVQTITTWRVCAVLALLSVGVADAGEITVPAGFRIDVFAENVGGARALAVDSEGVLVVSISSRGRVLALPAGRGAGRPTEVVTILKDLDRPNGDRKSKRLNSSHLVISNAAFSLKKKKKIKSPISTL